MGNFTERNFRRGREHGFTYIALLIFVAIMGVLLATTGKVWSTVMKREKEQELIFVGGQFRNAISMYYKNSNGQTARYPMSLEDLLKDPRYPDTRRYLRKIYLDPVSNSMEWGLVKGPNGEIFGVHSLSVEEPIKKSNFSLADHEFEGKTQYSDWLFMFAVKAGAVPQAPVSQVPTPQVPLRQVPVR
ncbi:MAG: type II secretion system protein [Gallionella sp.]